MIDIRLALHSVVNLGSVGYNWSVIGYAIRTNMLECSIHNPEVFYPYLINTGARHIPSDLWLSYILLGV